MHFVGSYEGIYRLEFWLFDFVQTAVYYVVGTARTIALGIRVFTWTPTNRFLLLYVLFLDVHESEIESQSNDDQSANNAQDTNNNDVLSLKSSSIRILSPTAI